MVERRTAEDIRLERTACLKMAIFMMLAGMVFTFSPNPTAFARLAANGIAIQPTELAILNYGGAALYLWICSGAAQHYAMPVRRALFFIASVPILVYLLPIGIIGIALGMSAPVITYIGIYGVILLLITGVYQGYSLRLERVSLVGLALLMVWIAVAFAQTPFVLGFHLPTSILVFLALAGGLGYVLLLTPPARLLTLSQLRAIFIGSEVVVPVYALFYLGNNLLFGGSWIIPLVLIVFYFLIALLAYTLYRYNVHVDSQP